MKGRLPNGFDRLAPIYDSLARLVYGRSIVRAQTCFLNEIPAASKVLILGGGTGWILSELFTLRPDCEVWFVESSAGMMRRAKKRQVIGEVHFILGTLDDFQDTSFDVVVTYFFLDLFSERTLTQVIQSVLMRLKPKALWLCADFMNRNKWWQTVLLKIMYWFFRVTCKIEAEKLPEWDRYLAKAGLGRLKSKDFYGRFIESGIYTRVKFSP